MRLHARAVCISLTCPRLGSLAGVPFVTIREIRGLVQALWGQDGHELHELAERLLTNIGMAHSTATGLYTWQRGRSTPVRATLWPPP